MAYLLVTALERISAIPQISEIVVTDTVPIPPEKRLPNMSVLSVAPSFGEAILRNYAAPIHRRSIYLLAGRVNL